MNDREGFGAVAYIVLSNIIIIVAVILAFIGV